MHSFYSHFSPDRVGTAAQLGLRASSISLSFYDHPGANGKALACVDVPTRAHGALPHGAERRSSLHAVRSWKVATSSDRNSHATVLAPRGGRALTCKSFAFP